MLRRKPVKAPYLPPAVTEISYTSLALGLQPAPLLPTHSSGTHASDTSNKPAEVTDFCSIHFSHTQSCLGHV